MKREELLNKATELSELNCNLEQIRKGICYSSDTEIRSLTESCSQIADSLESIAWNLDRLADIKSKEHDAVFRF